MEYEVEYTDTFGGEANYCWVKRATVTMPELTHYGYTESTTGQGIAINGNYSKANRAYERELMKRAKAAVGLTGVKGRKHDCGDTIDFRPYGSCTVMFINAKF